MAQDPEITNPNIALPPSPDIGKANEPAEGAGSTPYSEGDDNLDAGGIDKTYWLRCLEDGERAEQNWRQRARDIIQIYRNEGAATRNSSKISSGPVTFNILFANTEVMLPAIYTKPPRPVVRSRFTKIPTPMAPTLQPPQQAPMMPPGPSASTPVGAAPLGAPQGGPAAPIGAPPGPPTPGGPLPPDLGAPPGMGMPPPPPEPPPLALGAGLGAPPSGPYGALPGAPPPPMPMMAQAAPSRPPQEAIETAAAIMEKALEIVVEDENSNEATKTAIKDVLLPGRGVCRVRWKPQMQARPVMAGDGMTPLPGGGVPGEPPPTEDIKVWEEVGDEYVYWEDLLMDPVKQAADTNWIAFRHLFTSDQLDEDFGDSEQLTQLKGKGRLGDLLKWTDESAAKNAIGGGSAMKSASKLGNVIKKAMVWEIWDRIGRRIIWFVREASGLTLRVDPDTLKLQGFFPIPVPMLSIRTSDSRIPRPFYDLYARLAEDLDETSAAISRVTKQIKIRGGYNSSSKEIASILKADDGKMIAVDGVDMLNGGLQNHIWLVPVDQWVAALDKLYLARDQQKQAIYEIMGISDIMRGASKASETATAQRIKGTMGTVRLDDQKQQADNFVRDLMRLKAEIIGQNFSPETLEAMTGELVSPEVMAILRSDFMRTCTVDIEADSTVQVDEQVEQQSMAMIMQSVQAVMQGAVAMLNTGILPPQLVLQMSLEMLKMFLHPVRYSRGVVELIDDFQEQLQAQIAMQAMMPPPAPGMAPPGAGPPQLAGPSGPGGPLPSHGPGPPPPGGGQPPPGSNGGGPPGNSIAGRPY